MRTSAFRISLAVALIAALYFSGAGARAAEPSQTGQAIVHTMRFGDSLYLLSKIYGVTTESIRKTNPDVADWSVLRIGDMIVIPVARSFTPSVTTPFFYVVQPGETSTTIARKFEVEHATLARANGSKFFPFPVTAGQTILIPAGPHIHVVLGGETLSGIAAAFGTNPDLLKKVNNLSGDSVVAGTSLFIPYLYNAQPRAPISGETVAVPAITGAETASPTASPTVAGPTPTRTPRPTPTATATRKPSGKATATPNSPGSTGGPLVYRMVFLETMELDPSRYGGAIGHMRLEFRGGRPPFTLFSDDVLVGANLYPGWRVDFDTIYSTIHYDQLTTCNAVLTHTLKLVSADGQTFNEVYYIGPFDCPGPTVIAPVTRTPGP